MFAVFLFLSFFTFNQLAAETEPASWPLFEFWNPLTWLNPRFSSETMFYLLRGGRVPHQKIYQQLKKALLPSKLFFGNLIAEQAVRENERKKKPSTDENHENHSHKKSKRGKKQ